MCKAEGQFIKKKTSSCIIGPVLVVERRALLGLIFSSRKGAIYM